MMEENNLTQPVQQPVAESTLVENQELEPQKPRIKVILLSLLGLILVGGVAYGAFSIGKKQTAQPTLPKQEEAAKPSPTPDETAGWKTYSGSDYTFDYPSDWELSESNKGVFLKKIDETQEKVLLPGENQDSATYIITILSEINTDGLPVKDYYLSRFASSSRTEAESALKEVTVAGESGILYSEGAAPASGATKIILVPHEGKFYSFEYGALAHKDTHLKFYEVFDQILSTFKFLPAESSTDETVDWEIYSNRQYKFSFKYPSDFSQNTRVQGNFFWVNLNENKANSIMIEAKTEYLPGEVNNFLDTEATGQKDINGNVWKTYSLAQGYCDGPSCTSPIFALQIEKNKVLYSVTINNQNKMTELQEKILSTFKFLE